MDSWEGKENTKKGAESRFHRDYLGFVSKAVCADIRLIVCLMYKQISPILVLLMLLKD